uniref:Uncharacterized protein n=1 Tax=Tanacetum cinerariifolium TaxID=118510 RepID=A0A6L2LAV5_TANCI|nr:hypothetical protein [Tanacetum cinerariifolium]
MPEHQSDIFVIFTVTMEILLDPTLNKLLVGDVGDSIWIELVTLGIDCHMSSVRIESRAARSSNSNILIVNVELEAP